MLVNLQVRLRQSYQYLAWLKVLEGTGAQDAQTTNVLNPGSILKDFCVFFVDAANCLISPPIISYTDFYNSTLDHIDLMEEYHNWQCYGNSHR